MVYHMTEDSMNAIFGALADPTRRAILARLASGEMTVSELAEPFAMSQPAVSKHLKVLERAGLIARRRDAQRRPCRLRPEPLKTVADWVALYEAGLAAYRERKFAAAIGFFQKLIAVREGDGASRFMIDRCQALIEAPPGDDWKATTEMSAK